MTSFAYNKVTLVFCVFFLDASRMVCLLSHCPQDSEKL